MTAIWTYTATNTTLCHAFKDSRALCNKGIKPRVGPTVGSSSGPYVAHYITLDDVRNRPYTTACHKCRAKLEATTMETAPEAPQGLNPVQRAVAFSAAIRDEKLTPVMIEAVGRIGRAERHAVRTVTIVALIERGILTAAKPSTAGSHLLTEKGVNLYRQLNSSEPNQDTTEAYVTAHTVVYEIGDRVECPRRPDLGIGEVKEARPNRFGQLLMIAWPDSPSVARPSDTRGLVKVEPETTVDLTSVDADDIVIEPSTNPAVLALAATDAARAAVAERRAEATTMGLNCEEVEHYASTGKHLPSAQGVRKYYVTRDTAIPVPYVPAFTAKPVERDESAEFLARHPETPAAPMVLGSPKGRRHPYVTVSQYWERATDRDKLARSIAYEFSHIFATWGNGTPEPDVKIKPRELDRPQMIRFYQNGSMYQPSQLLAEIRDEMADQIAGADTTERIGRLDLVDSLLWLGWLNAYVLESGKLDRSGWQSRVRGTQDGWEGMGLYSTEPSDETELPAWADVEDDQSFGCVAVISPQGRYQEAESCMDGVTREEYYASGEEHALCEQHRLAKIALEDRGW